MDVLKWNKLGKIFDPTQHALTNDCVQFAQSPQALVFSGGILLAFLILTGMAVLLMKMVRRFFPSGWSYLWRQGLANLYRPNNQTII